MASDYQIESDRFELQPWQVISFLDKMTSVFKLKRYFQGSCSVWLQHPGTEMKHTGHHYVGDILLEGH